MSAMKGWLIAYYLLFAGILLTGALNMLQAHGGFLTNHAADIVGPAWLYVVARGRHSAHGRQTMLQRTVGRSPAFAASSLFAASALTEVSQRYWPRGIFPGRFDPIDIIAYAGGLALCYAADTRWPQVSPPAAIGDQPPAV